MKNTERLIRAIPITVTFLLAAACILGAKNFTVEELLSYTPESIPLAAAVLLFSYAFKSLSVVFPLSVLYIASGVIFPLWLAWIVNLGGLFLCVTLPYWVGRISGRELAEHIISVHPKAARINEVTSQNEVFTAYLLRVVGVVPGDLASILLGAMGMNYRSYLVGSLLGLLPGMLIQSALGLVADDPSSPVFWLLCLLMVAVCAASALLYAKHIRKNIPRPAPPLRRPDGK